MRLYDTSSEAGPCRPQLPQFFLVTLGTCAHAIPGARNTLPCFNPIVSFLSKRGLASRVRDIFICLPFPLHTCGWVRGFGTPLAVWFFLVVVLLPQPESFPLLLLYVFSACIGVMILRLRFGVEIGSLTLTLNLV